MVQGILVNITYWSCQILTPKWTKVLIGSGDSQFPNMNTFISNTNVFFFFVMIIKIKSENWTKSFAKTKKKKTTLYHIESFRGMWSGMWIMCHVANPTGKLPGPFIFSDIESMLGPGRGSVWCLRMTKPEFFPLVACVMRLVLGECWNHFSLILWISLLSH